MYYTLTYDRDESSLKHLSPQLPSCISIAFIYTTFTDSLTCPKQPQWVPKHRAMGLGKALKTRGAETRPIARNGGASPEDASRRWIRDTSAGRARRRRRVAVVDGSWEAATQALLTHVWVQHLVLFLPLSTPYTFTINHGPAAARYPCRAWTARVCIQLCVARARVLCYRGDRRRFATEGEWEQMHGISACRKGC